MKNKRSFVVILASFAVIPLVIIVGLTYLVSNGDSVSKIQLIWISSVTAFIMIIFSTIIAALMHRNLFQYSEKLLNTEDSSTYQNEKSLEEANMASAELGNSVNTLSSTSQNMVTSADEVSHAINEIASGSNTQASEIANIVNLLTNLASEVNLVEEKLYIVRGNAKEAGDKAVVANDTIMSFEGIISSVNSVPKLIEETEESLKKTVEENKIVLEKVKNVSEVAQEVSAASEEIFASSEELVGSSKEISNLFIKIHKQLEVLRKN